MTIQAWWAFIALSSFAIVCPGPAIALAVSNALHFRFNIVVVQSLGNLLGLGLVSTFVIVGIGQFGDFSTQTLSILRFGGALYFVFMGWRHIQRHGSAGTPQWGRLPCGNKCSKAAFSEGFFIAATNPQTALFFLSLFPNFIDVEVAVGGQALLLVPSVLAVSFVSMMGYGLVARLGKRRFLAAMRPELISKVMGVGLILFGAALGVSQFWGL